MGKFRDLTGLTFGRLAALEIVGKSKSGNYLWRCCCSCGEEVTVAGGHLTSGNTNSCGCYRRDQTVKANTVHGDRYTDLYKTWKSMKVRCLNPKDKDYHRYGDRGITVCDRWLDYVNFKEDMEESYKAHVKLQGKKNTTIERIDNEGSYTPGNCVWATRSEQRANQRDRCDQQLFEATRVSDGYTTQTNNKREFARSNSLDRRAINRVLKGSQKIYKGWAFRYLAKEEKQ